MTVQELGDLTVVPSKPSLAANSSSFGPFGRDMAASFLQMIHHQQAQQWQQLQEETRLRRDLQQQHSEMRNTELHLHLQLEQKAIGERAKVEEPAAKERREARNMEKVNQDRLLSLLERVVGASENDVKGVKSPKRKTK